MRLNICNEIHFTNLYFPVKIMIQNSLGLQHSITFILNSIDTHYRCKLMT